MKGSEFQETVQEHYHKSFLNLNVQLITMDLIYQYFTICLLLLCVNDFVAKSHQDMQKVPNSLCIVQRNIHLYVE